MADVTHEFGDDGFHEIHLSGKQLVFLFMATTVVSIVIFLCGVQVGRGVPAERVQEGLADPLAAASVAPAATPPAAALAPPDEAPAPPSEAEGLSYKDRLAGDAAPRESLRPAAEPPAPPPAQRRARGKRLRGKPAPGRRPPSRRRPPRRRPPPAPPSPARGCSRCTPSATPRSPTASSSGW